MGMHQHRIRAAQRADAMGGGLTAESVTDTATDGDIMEHDTGEGPAGMLGAVTLDWDETYGPFGTRSDLPPADPFTASEAREVASEFAQPYLPTAQDSRDVAQEANVGTVTLGVGQEAYPLAGADPLRKRLVVTNVTYGSNVLRSSDAYVGDRSVQAQGGSGAMLLRSGYIDAAVGGLQAGDSLEFTHTAEVWVIPAVVSGVVGQPVTITYVIERYTK